MLEESLRDPDDRRPYSVTNPVLAVTSYTP
jgi:hypothetical protein